MASTPTRAEIAARFTLHDDPKKVRKVKDLIDQDMDDDNSMPGIKYNDETDTWLYVTGMTSQLRSDRLFFDNHPNSQKWLWFPANKDYVAVLDKNLLE